MAALSPSVANRLASLMERASDDLGKATSDLGKLSRAEREAAFALVPPGFNLATAYVSLMEWGQKLRAAATVPDLNDTEGR
jgi:hypothetical protein